MDRWRAVTMKGSTALQVRGGLTALTLKAQAAVAQDGQPLFLPHHSKD